MKKIFDQIRPGGCTEKSKQVRQESCVQVPTMDQVKASIFNKMTETLFGKSGHDWCSTGKDKPTTHPTSIHKPKF